jgi:hypothetical protein
MEVYRKIEQPVSKFIFEVQDDLSLREAPQNPEVYPGCLVEAMFDSNRGSAGALEAVESTIIACQGRNFAMACGKCGITLVRDSGVVYGASKCPEVVAGELSLGELS